MNKPLLIISACLLLFTGCQQQYVKDVSTLLGGVVGGYGANRACKDANSYWEADCTLVGVAAGVMIGNFIGSQIVKHYMQPADKQELNHVLQQNSNQNSQWHNNQTGTTFQVTDIRSYENCKEFTLSASQNKQLVGSEKHKACHQQGQYI